MSMYHHLCMIIGTVFFIATIVCAAFVFAWEVELNELRESFKWTEEQITVDEYWEMPGYDKPMCTLDDVEKRLWSYNNDDTVIKDWKSVQDSPSKYTLHFKGDDFGEFQDRVIHLKDTIPGMKYFTGALGGIATGFGAAGMHARYFESWDWWTYVLFILLIALPMGLVSSGHYPPIVTLILYSSLFGISCLWWGIDHYCVFMREQEIETQARERVRMKRRARKEEAEKEKEKKMYNRKLKAAEQKILNYNRCDSLTERTEFRLSNYKNDVRDGCKKFVTPADYISTQVASHYRREHDLGLQNMSNRVREKNKHRRSVRSKNHKKGKAQFDRELRERLLRESRKSENPDVVD